MLTPTGDRAKRHRARAEELGGGQDRYRSEGEVVLLQFHYGSLNVCTAENSGQEGQAARGPFEEVNATTAVLYAESVLAEISREKRAARRLVFEGASQITQSSRMRDLELTFVQLNRPGYETCSGARRADDLDGKEKRQREVFA